MEQPRTKFQSPERIHAFGNVAMSARRVEKVIVSIPREDSCFWEVGGMDNADRIMRFQSPERIHAFGNATFMLDGQADVAFQSPERIHAFGNIALRRNLNTSQVSIPREDSCFWERKAGTSCRKHTMFQSPERIHAFGNHIQAPPIKRSWIGFNPQRGFMLLGTLCIQSLYRATDRFNPQRGFMLLGT